MLGVSEEFFPIPASKIIPEWYKNLDSYIGGEKKPDKNATSSATAKRCMPIFDAMSSGYIIVTHTDLWISQIEREDGTFDQYYQWSSLNAIEFHPKQQLPEHPNGDGHKTSYPKWVNAWGIKTPPGYSTLFIPPIHRETPIVALPGVVDTDKYSAPVNFPFVLRDPSMTGLIPAGTPVIQAIPIKREDWEMQIGKEKDFNENIRVTNKLRTKFFDSYKNQFRQKKEYK